MSSVSKPNDHGECLDAAVEQAIAVCDGDMRAANAELLSQGASKYPLPKLILTATTLKSVRCLKTYSNARS